MSAASDAVAVLSIGRTMLEADDLLKGRFDVVDGRAAPLDEVVARDGDRIRAVMTRGGEKVPADLIARLPKLEIIANLGVGYDKVDVAAAAKAGVVVTNTPGVLTDEVADFTVGLLLSTIREIPQSDAYVRSGGWSEKPFRLTASLRDRSIGIVGMGQIGEAIARRLEPFGRPIAYHARRKVAALPYEHYPTALGLAEAVDTLILIVPGGPATDKMIDASVLSALGSNGVLINVARGSVVDEAALVRALAAREIAGAGLDVFEREPHPSPELLGLDNVVLCSHVGSGTHHTRGRMAALGAENITSWFDGRGPVTPVPETPWPRPA
ncbi:2-hydroxyacid dehydrogenase [Methylopila sp. M107]|uniref:2-hydroxyacid dehydrogenase n=1 Tax=Methylopila sp. M107 TaxID=1101190 RepID=UPI00037F5036|nr:2-hydroxyacid dehydrogenase [Methylopila sp. M107]